MNQTDVNFLNHWPRGTFSFADAGQFEWGVAVFWIAVGRKTGAFFIIRLFIFTLFDQHWNCVSFYLLHLLPALSLRVYQSERDEKKQERRKMQESGTWTTLHCCHSLLKFCQIVL